MSDRCAYEDVVANGRWEPGWAECRLDREEYANDCEGCPERYGADDAGADAYSARSGG